MLALCFAILHTASASTNQQYVFQKLSFPTGNRPSGIAVADVNGDGIQDLIITNQGDNTVSVLLGRADGTFASKTDFATAFGPYAIVAGDFNKDGKIDIAVTSACGPSCGQVSVLLGNGDGTFQAHVEYPAGIEPLGLVAADFNGDGNQDLAVVDLCGPSCGFVSVLLGKGDGTFQPKTDLAVGPGPDAIVVQDLNNDGKLDLIVTDQDGVSVLLANGDGTFQPHADYPSSYSPAALVAADFDGDHIPDLVITHNGSPWPLTIMKGKGDGTFLAEQQIPTGLITGAATSEIAAADVNGDGKQDLLLSIVSQGGAVVLLGNGDGTFQQPMNFASGSYAFAFAVQDVNGDGTLDLEIVDQESNFVAVLLGNGDGTFSPRQSLAIDPPGINQPSGMSGVIADFNGDGKPDLAIANTAGVVHVLLGRGDGTYEPSVDTTAGASGSALAADFNADGVQDLVLSNGSGAVLLLGKGDGTFSAPTQAVTTASSVQRKLLVGDFNNDGKLDLVTLANGFEQVNPIYVSLGNGDGTFQAPKTMWNSTSVPMSIAAGDFNGDGKLDLVVTVNPNGIAVMLGNGDGTFQSPVAYATDELPDAITVADLNGDGHPDIIAIGNKVDVFLGKGDGTFPTRVDYDAGYAPFDVLTGDLNADGKPDVIVSAGGSVPSGTLEILLGNGDGTLQPRVEIAHGSGGGISNLIVGDLNKDGTSDVVVVGGVDAQFLSVPIATLSPSTLQFGNEPIGQTTAPMTVTLANNGNAPLTFASVTASTSFGISNNCAVVAARSSCSLGITFSPTASGASLGVLSLSDNAPNHAQRVGLSGNGQASFSLAVSSGSSSATSVTAGSPASYSLTLVPLGGFNQSVSFSCSGEPAATNCTVSPSPAVLDGQNPVSLNVKISTTARSVLMPLHFKPPTQFPLVEMVFALWLYAVLLRSARLQYKVVPVSAAVLFLAVLVVAAGCGGGTAGSTGNQVGTPAGTYTITINATTGTGSNTQQQNLKLTLTVQ